MGREAQPRENKPMTRISAYKPPPLIVCPPDRCPASERYSRPCDVHYHAKFPWTAEYPGTSFCNRCGKEWAR